MKKKKKTEVSLSGQSPRLWNKQGLRTSSKTQYAKLELVDYYYFLWVQPFFFFFFSCSVQENEVKKGQIERERERDKDTS